MAFIRVYGRATPDRAGARPYHGGRTLHLMLTWMGAARLDASFCCFSKRALALSELKLFPISLTRCLLSSERAMLGRAGAPPVA